MKPSIETPTIPVLDLSPEIDGLWDEVQAALLAVVRSGKFIMGPDVRRSRTRPRRSSAPATPSG